MVMEERILNVAVSLSLGSNVRGEGAGCNLSHHGTEACPEDDLGKAELLDCIFLFSLHRALKRYEKHFLRLATQSCAFLSYITVECFAQ